MINFDKNISRLYLIKISKWFNMVIFWGMAFLFLFYLVRCVASPILKNYMNQYTQSDIRATIFSVRDFIIRIVFAVIGPLLGWITDNINLKSAFLLAGTIYIVSAIIVVFPWMKRREIFKFHSRVD